VVQACGYGNRLSGENDAVLKIYAIRTTFFDYRKLTGI
jgi:hypothetical protein